MLNKNKIKNKKYVFILGIITHIILIFLYLLKNTKTTYNIIFYNSLLYSTFIYYY